MNTTLWCDAKPLVFRPLLAMLALAVVVLPSTSRAQEAARLAPEAAGFWLRFFAPEDDAYARALAEAEEAIGGGRLAQALRALQQAIVLEPAEPQGYVVAIAVAAEIDENDAVIDLVGRLRAIEPEADARYRVCFAAAIAYAKLARYTDGIAENQRCLDTFPESRVVLLGNAAELAMAEGALEEALAGYDAAIALEPRYQQAWSGRAAALARLGRDAEARASLLTVLALDPDAGFMFAPGTFFVPEGEAHFHLALIYRELGRHDDARLQLDKYLASKPRADYAATAERLRAELVASRDPLVDVYPLPSKDVSAAVVDTARRWLVLGTAGGRVAAVRLADSDTVELRSEGSSVLDLAFTPDGKQVKALLADGTLLRYAVSAKKLTLLDPVELGGPLNAGDLSADASQALLRSEQGVVTVDLGGGTQSTLADASSGSMVWAVAPGGGEWFSAPLLSRATGEAPLFLETGAFFLDAEFLPDGGGVLTGTSDGVVHFGLDGRATRVLLPGERHHAEVLSLDPTGRYLCVVLQATVEIWDLQADSD